MDKDKKVFCEKCNARVQLSECIKEDVVEGDVSVIYIECTGCGYKYLSYYTDPKIKRLQKLQQKLKERIDKKMKELKNKYKDDLNS